MLGGEDLESVNSELRYITIELMKIAAQRKMSFEDVVVEFLSNANTLQRLIEAAEGGEGVPRFTPSAVPRVPKAPKMKPDRQ